MNRQRIEVTEATEGSTFQIRGRVVLPEERSSKPTMLRLWVNGFQQAPVKLAAVADDSNSVTYSAQVALNQSGSNWIELDLPGFEKEDSSNKLLRLPCKQPMERKRLHVLPIAIGATDRDTERLIALTVKALGGNQTGKRTF